jgi:protein-disulfide isomerase
MEKQSAADSALAGQAWMPPPLVLVPALTGLAASAALLVDTLRPVPLFCAEGDSCDIVRHTVFAAPLGVPLPWFGLAGFLAIACTALVPVRKARVAAVVLASVAALVGMLLLTVQVMFGHFCPYCCVADASALFALAAASWDVTRPSVAAPAPRWIRITGGAMVGLSVGAPLAAGLIVPNTVPEAIAAEMAGAPGKLTVVDFVDFECPYCRMTQEELQPVLDAHKDRLHVVRRQVPLKSHAHAHDAARAACCAEQLGKGEAMADALFATPVENLTPEGCEQLAQKLGISLDAYRSCVVDPATDARIEKDRDEFKATGGRALPTIWIGRRQLVGAQSREAIAKAVDEEIKASGG